MIEHHQKQVKAILDHQQQLKLVRSKISPVLEKHIFVLSADYSIREEIKAYFATLGFLPDHINTMNSTTKIINMIKLDRGKIDLIICHAKIMDRRISFQTGFEFLNIVNDMQLKKGQLENIKFMFMEKNFDKNEIVTALKSGVTQFLVLPCNPISLGSKLIEIFKEELQSSTPREVKDLLYEANKLRDMGLFEKAIPLYNHCLEISSKNADIITEKANTLLEMGDLDEAIQLFKQAIEIESNFPRAYQGLGVAYEQMGDIDEAKKNYQKALELEPNNVQACYSIGVLCQDEKKYDEAKVYFDKGIKTNKKFVKNFLGLAKNYEALEKPKEALNVYKEAMKINPKQSFLYVSAGELCLKFNLDELAEELFTSAIGLNDGHIHIYNRLGIALRKQKKHTKAIENYGKALKIQPDDPILHYNQAKAFFFNAEEEKAIDMLNKAFQIHPDLKLQFEKDRSFRPLLEKYPDKFKFE